jgi:hypothetical protein
VKAHKQAESLTVGVIATLAIVVLGILAANFWKSPLAHSMEQWGQFGDYMGGVLNPLAAFAALLLLARSIALQVVGKALGVEPGGAGLRIVRHYKDPSQRILEMTEAVCPAERASVSVQLRRGTTSS